MKTIRSSIPRYLTNRMNRPLLWLAYLLSLLAIEPGWSATGELRWSTEPEVARLQQLIANGKVSEALVRLAAEMERDPQNPRVAYDCGIAAYAAGHYEEALLSFDRAETEGRGTLVRQARFEKGNAEYQVGLEAAKVNLDDTISHWKESIRNYDLVLNDQPHVMAKSNRSFVQQQLLQLLLAAGKTNLQTAQQPNLPAAQKLDRSEMPLGNIPKPWKWHLKTSRQRRAKRYHEISWPTRWRVKEAASEESAPRALGAVRRGRCLRPPCR